MGPIASTGRMSLHAAATGDQRRSRSRALAVNTVGLRDWLRRHRGVDLADYEALRRWSVEHVSDFWQALWDHFGVVSPTPHARRARRGPDARRTLVRRRAGQLRDAARAAGRGERCGRRAGARVPQRTAAARRAQRGDRLGRSGRPGGDAGGGAGGAGRPARRPRRRLPAQHAARDGRRSSPARRSGRSGACARPTWAWRRCATASGRSIPKC